MVGTRATVGGCAQIGRNVHLTGGVGIGGVLEPPQAAPVVVEDDAFIGSDTQLVAPVTIGRGATIGAGSTITKDAPPDSLTLSRAKQISIPGWKRPAKKSEK